ncbi:MAG: App1 family protein [Desulfococcaceae bacterium]
MRLLNSWFCENSARFYSAGVERLRRVGRRLGETPLEIQPFRGYGVRDEAFLMGRVHRGMAGTDARETDGPLRRLIRMLPGLLQPGASGVTVAARFQGAERRVRSDRDGFFRIHLRPDRTPAADRQWHPMELSLESAAGVSASAAPVRGDVYVPPESARYVVISDVDDTVMETGVANKLMMFWRLFAETAHARVAFPGVSALYRAFHDGRTGDQLNPMLYVSRGPWTLYEALGLFFNLNRIPVGPILFLRDWGLRLGRPIPRRSSGHKLGLIRRMVTLYREFPFILIGDSGQRDPEIYARVVRDFPGRVAAIYIRDVGRGNGRAEAIARLAREVAKAGSVLVLAADSLAMGRHAAETGLIPEAALAEIRREGAAEMAEPIPASEREEKRTVIRGEEWASEARPKDIQARRPE